MQVLGRAAPRATELHKAHQGGGLGAGTAFGGGWTREAELRTSVMGPRSLSRGGSKAGAASTRIPGRGKELAPHL